MREIKVWMNENLSICLFLVDDLIYTSINFFNKKIYLENLILSSFSDMVDVYED